METLPFLDCFLFSLSFLLFDSVSWRLGFSFQCSQGWAWPSCLLLPPPNGWDYRDAWPRLSFTYFLTETLVMSEQYFVLPKEMERAPNYPVSYCMCTAPRIYLRNGYNQRLPQRKIFLPLVWLSFLWFFLLFWALVGKLRICSHVTHWSIMHLFSLCIIILLYISIYVIGIS